MSAWKPKRMRWAAGGFLLVAAVSGRRAGAMDASDADRPVVETPTGRQAFEDVRDADNRGSSSVPRSWKAAQGLASADASERRWAADYLLALFRQTRSDQEHGRTPRGRGMKLGPGPRDDGAAIRWAAVNELVDVSITPGSTEALRPALWLWREDKSHSARSAAMRLLVQVRHPDADAAILDAVRDDGHSYDVLEHALVALGARRLPGVEAEVRALCLHYRASIRRAAAGAAHALRFADLPVYSDSSPFVRSLDRRLREMAARVRPEVPAGSRWVRLRAKPDPANPGLQGERAGWRLPDHGEKPVVLDWFGEVQDELGDQWTIEEDTLAKAAERLIIWRSEFNALGTDDFDGRRGIEGRIGIGRFGDYSGRKWSGTLPEALIAAWAYLRDDRATAAALVLPLLETAESEAKFFDVMRDEVAVRLDQRMLEAFRRVEYPQALALARHLASPLFDGWYEQARAKALADELPRRSEDFSSLSLPSPSDWEAMISSKGRADLVEFLAERLRLIRAWQWSIPGGISYADEQFLAGVDPWHDSRRESSRVINPYVELLRMDLRGSEVGSLLPLLASPVHLHASSTHRVSRTRTTAFKSVELRPSSERSLSRAP